MHSAKSPRIIHLPESVGGNAYCLSNAMRRLGLDSECWIVKPNYLQFGHDRSIASQDDGYLVTEVKRMLALRYVFQYDVVFFNFGSTLFRPIALSKRPGWSWSFLAGAKAYMLYATVMQRLELALLRMRRVRMYVQYQGDDARQGDYCRKHFSVSPASEVDEHYYNDASDRHKRRQIRLLSRHCRHVYALNPDLLNVLPKEARFLPYSHIALEEWKPCFSDSDSRRPLRIGHAPTHRGVKGSSYFLAALERLRAAGYEFELVLIEKLSQQDAKAIYQTLDVVLDQLFVGWYGGLAVEAMALGKPVMAYIREEDLAHIPHSMKEELPIIRTSIHTLDSDLKALLDRPRSELVDLGRRSRAFVEHWHDPQTVAHSVLTDMLIGQS